MVALSYIFFLAFLFLIVVVLMNLLNGLAVSDTGIQPVLCEASNLKEQSHRFYTCWKKVLDGVGINNEKVFH